MIKNNMRLFGENQAINGAMICCMAIIMAVFTALAQETGALISLP